MNKSPDHIHLWAQMLFVGWPWIGPGPFPWLQWWDLSLPPPRVRHHYGNRSITPSPWLHKRSPECFEGYPLVCDLGPTQGPGDPSPAGAWTRVAAERWENRGRKKSSSSKDSRMESSRGLQPSHGAIPMPRPFFQSALAPEAAPPPLEALPGHLNLIPSG